jgi:hypothetical protein
MIFLYKCCDPSQFPNSPERANLAKNRSKKMQLHQTSGQNLAEVSGVGQNCAALRSSNIARWEIHGNPL